MTIVTPSPPTAAAAARVLLVEDDEGDAFLVRELLADTEAAVEISWARSLAEAREQAPEGFECVLLDLGLPDAHGFDALRGVLESVPDAAVLVLTGLDDERTGIEALALGAQDYLVKGQVDGPLLGRSIRYALERKRLDRELRRLYRTEALAAENARLERGLVPQPRVADPDIAVVQRYEPGRDAVLGGDFYDVIQISDGSLYVLIGDVAGHPAPLLLLDEPMQLPDDLVGPALGVVPGVIWGSRPVELPHDWRLLLFTDGLVEGHDPEHGRLGVDGLVRLARASANYADSTALVDDLFQGARRLHGGALPDDVAVLVIERLDRGAGGGAMT